MSAILKVENLNVTLTQRKSSKKLVEEVSFEVRPGECLGILGESGSGKSMTVKSVLGLLDKNFQISGRAIFDGQDLLRESKEELRRLRGSRITMVLQNPMTCFDPLYRIGSQMAETFATHTTWSAQEIRSHSLEILAQMRIRNGEEVLEKYPHQLSGGMLQRIMIGIAMALEPELLIADEPTTALDVTIQAQILKLMDKLVKEQGASLILITHDLAVVSQVADRIIVMYCGKIVESGSRDDVIHRPSHPYTEGLLNSIPRMGEEQKRLESIPGMVPSMLDLPQGCYFAPRCKYCQDICRTVAPENHEVAPGHCAACHFPLTGGESHE